MGFTGQLLAPDSVSNATNTGSVELGTRVWYNGCEYVYVYNAAAVSIPTGAMVRSLSNSTGYSVSYPPDALLGVPFAINRNTTVSAAQYFWACTRGYVPLRGSTTTLVPGALARMGTSGLFTTYTIATAITNTYWLPVNIVVSVETEGSNLTGWGYVNFS